MDKKNSDNQRFRTKHSVTKNLYKKFGNKISGKKSRKQEMEQSKLHKIFKNISSRQKLEHKCKGNYFFGSLCNKKVDEKLCTSLLHKIQIKK
jgi:hypothetical protein